MQFHGMRGVAHLLLARGSDVIARPQLLAYASEDLARSRQLGDRSPQHFEYEIEVLLRLNQAEPSDHLLATAEELLAGVDVASRRLAYNAGDLALTRGVSAMSHEHYEDAARNFSEAIERYAKGLDIAPRKFDMSDDELVAKRGYARLRAFNATVESGSADYRQLENAISDLERGTPDPHSGAFALPEALLWRAQRHRRDGHHDLAIRDLDRALGFPPATRIPEALDVRRRIEVALAECRVEAAIVHGEGSVLESALAALIEADPSADPSIPVLAAGVRSLVEMRTLTDRVPQTIRAAAAQMKRLMARPHCVGPVRGFAASYAAGTLMRLGDYLELSELREACCLYTEAVELSEGPLAPELLGLAADVKLKLAKVLLASNSALEEPRGLLEDACVGFGWAIERSENASAQFQAQVAHSKLGEALLRLNSLTGQAALAEQARDHLERSRQLGNDAPELLGLLGDCYYRLGRSQRRIDHLRRAAELKIEARRAAESSASHDVSLRENWSLTARILGEIWQFSGDIDALGGAIEAACSAHSVDPSWPWPLFQLASFARERSETLEAALAGPHRKKATEPLVDLVRNRRADALEDQGARLAVENQEFRRRILGGRRQSVYVLDDLHGLLSETLVLKKNDIDTAYREADFTKSLGEYLRKNGADPRLIVPRPVSVVEFTQADAVYVMRHAKGQELGSAAIHGRRDEGAHPLSAYRLAIDFLAWFHAWAWTEGRGHRGRRPDSLDRVAESIAVMWKRAGATELDCRRLRDHSNACCLPAVHLEKGCSSGELACRI
jgi:tetratricopeptide (TPR) repeat protein